MLILVFGFAAQIALATVSVNGVGGSARFYCDAVRFSYEIGGTPTIQFRITDALNNPLSSVVNGTGNAGYPAETYQVTIPLNSEQPDSTALKIQYNTFGSWIDLAPFGLTACSGLLPGTSSSGDEDSSLPPPMYQPMGGEGARLSLFVFQDDNGSNNPVLAFYRIDEDSTGHLLFFIASSGLTEYPDKPDENIEIFRSDDGKYAFHKLTSGEYQITVGPDNEGKVHVVIFTGIPPENVRGHTYSIYHLTGLLSIREILDSSRSMSVL